MVGYWLDFNVLDTDIFTLYRKDTGDKICTARLSQVGADNEGWQDALDNYFYDVFGIRPDEWEIG